MADDEDIDEEDPDEDDDSEQEDPGDDEETGEEDVTAPSFTFFEMRPRPNQTRFIAAVDEPASLLICMQGAPCAFSAESTRHSLRLDAWSPTYSLWLTDAAGNTLERIDAQTRRLPRNRP